MMIQAPVIQIDCSAGCHTIICHTHFRMAKSRCPLIDPHSMLNQSVIKRTRNVVNQLLIRNSRGDDPYINTTLNACVISSVIMR